MNPRYSEAGAIFDTIAGMVFGVVSIILVIISLLLTIRFFKIRKPFQRPLLILGIRYAFLSVLIANLAGIWMIVLQDRYIGDGGNFIVLHGLGFHALQTVIFPGRLLEKVQVENLYKKALIHQGSIAWMLALILIGIQTAMGQTVFEQSLFPILAAIFLCIWLGTVIHAGVLLLINRKLNQIVKKGTPT